MHQATTCFTFCDVLRMILKVSKGIFEEIVRSCCVCSQSDRLPSCKKLSFFPHLPDVQSWITSRIYVCQYLWHEILRTTHGRHGARYSETTIVTNRFCSVMAMKIAMLWIFRHGAPKPFFENSEFTKGIMNRFLAAHGIKPAEKFVGRLNKTRIVKQKHRAVK